MKELLKALNALEQLGAEWKVRRASTLYLRDTVECVNLVQTDEGVVRGLVRVRRNDIWRVQMEVVCYLNGRLKDDGTFKHNTHPKDGTVKIFEYDSTILFKYSKGLFGLGAGFRPIGAVSAEHQFLTDFADRLWVEVDVAQTAAEAEKVAADSQRRPNNETTARRALFGPVP